MRARPRARRARRCSRSRAAAATSRPPRPRPGSTLRATLVDPDGDGFLERGPAQPLAERRELGGGGEARPRDRPLRPDHGRARARRGVARPRAVPGPARPAVRADVPPAGGRDRPGARRRRARARRRAPAGRRVTGDLADNAQANELDLAIAVLRGGRADPSSGAPGYEGVQEARQPGPVLLPARQRRPAPPGPDRRRAAAVHGDRARRAVVPRARQPRRARAGRGPEHAARSRRLATGSRCSPASTATCAPPTDEASRPDVVAALLADPAACPAARGGHAGPAPPHAHPRAGGRAAARRRAGARPSRAGSTTRSTSGRACARSCSTRSAARAARAAW